MKRRGQDDRDNDVTAADCEACGYEGHTTPGGNQIVSFLDSTDSNANRVNLCEECQENFHRYSGARIKFDSDVLTPEQWSQVQIYKNVERLSRKDESLAEDLSREFCRVLKEWLNIAEQALVIERNNAEPDQSSICHTHDFCDANQAMLNAWEVVFGKDESPAITEGMMDEMRAFDLRLWNAAWTKAKNEKFHFPCAS